MSQKMDSAASHRKVKGKRTSDKTSDQEDERDEAHPKRSRRTPAFSPSSSSSSPSSAASSSTCFASASSSSSSASPPASSSTDLDERRAKPLQPPLTVSEYLNHSAIKPLLRRKASTWSSAERSNLAAFLSNRAASNDPLEYGTTEFKDYMAMAVEIDKMNDDAKFVEMADTIVMLVRWTGAAPLPADYMNILRAVNRFAGGVAAQTGNPGQPIAFVNTLNIALEVASQDIYQQLVGAFLTNANLHNTISVVRLNPTQITNPLNL